LRQILFFIGCCSRIEKSTRKEKEMPIRKLREFLDENQVKYVVISHSPAYTAQEIAASAHIPGKDIAKTVIVKLDGKMAMVVLPAPHKLDFDYLKKAAKAEIADLATEEEFKYLFPGCEIGAMPPFGNLYSMPTYVGQSLTEDEQIAFNAGTHKELVKLNYKDFERLVKPKVEKLSR
jgi:Ala-tRNA(Pro) deacylase